jgi:hypothetical protein
VANIFNRKLSNSVGTANTIIGSYTTGAGVRTVIIGLTIANTSAASITASIMFSDNTAGNTYIVKDAPVPAGGSLVAVGGDQKIVLTEGDKIMVRSSAASSLDAIMSILEQTP